MNKVLKYSAVALLGLFVLTGCRTSTVYNVENDPIKVKVSQDKIYEAIRDAGYSKGWKVTKVKPGLAQAKINLRKHMAIVEIPYTKDSFSIKYKNSLNLSYNQADGTIHSNYNGWIQNLENAINFQLSKYNN